VIQGGFDRGARARCAAGLLSLDLDGFGFGGWPLTPEGDLAEDTLAYTAKLMPDALPKYALGVGSPENVAHCYEMGYEIFDCVLPTRDARHHRLYVLDPDAPLGYSYLYILDDTYKRDPRPLSELCDCACCARFQRSYLHHLFKIQDGLAHRLATIHNLRFYTQWMERLRREGRSA
jgi:queuine tRNA-ribosyltransferase